MEAQEGDPDSLLNTVRALLKLRHDEPDLQADGELKVLCAEKGRPFVYRRGNLTLALNPSGEKLFVEARRRGQRSAVHAGQGRRGKASAWPWGHSRLWC